MKIIPVSEIVVPETRQRREFDPAKMLELAESIGSKGLMHAIVVRMVNGTPVLVAGERRLKTLASLYMMGGQVRYDNLPIPEGSIPCVDIGDLSPLEAEEAELEENAIRVDLTWQERAVAEARLHELRKHQASLRGETHSYIKTAEETRPEISSNRGAAEVSDSVRLSKNLEVHPELAKAKHRHEAIKILNKIEKKSENEAIARIVGKTFSAADHTLLNDDSLVWLKNCPGERFDVILTDPPYGMGADEFGDAGGALVGQEHAYADDAETLGKIVEVLSVESYRIAKAQAHLYLFCDIDQFPYLRDMFRLAGWKVHRTPLIWHKPKAHRVPWPEQGPRRHWETILYAVKGDKRVNYIASDVLSYDPDTNLGMAAQKPVALYRDLLARSAIAGSAVLDAFCGTGPIFPAAHELKVSATGIELNPATYAIAVQRVRNLT